MRHKHDGRSAMPEYRTWAAMIQRCVNPRNMNFKQYGGRGIKVCERWRNSFNTFLADMGPRPESYMTLDRIDNDGNYEPGNVQWASRASQSLNTRRNHRLTAFGQTKTLTEWSRGTGINFATLSSRLKRGVSVDEALSVQKLPRRRSRSCKRTRTITAFGQTKALHEWAVEVGVNRATIASRLDVGMLPEQALMPGKLGWGQSKTG